MIYTRENKFVVYLFFSSSQVTCTKANIFTSTGIQSGQDTTKIFTSTGIHSGQMSVSTYQVSELQERSDLPRSARTLFWIHLSHCMKISSTYSLYYPFKICRWLFPAFQHLFNQDVACYLFLHIMKQIPMQVREDSENKWRQRWLGDAKHLSILWCKHFTESNHNIISVRNLNHHPQTASWKHRLLSIILVL